MTPRIITNTEVRRLVIHAVNLVEALTWDPRNHHLFQRQITATVKQDGMSISYSRAVAVSVLNRLIESYYSLGLFTAPDDRDRYIDAWSPLLGYTPDDMRSRLRGNKAWVNRFLEGKTEPRAWMYASYLRDFKIPREVVREVTERNPDSTKQFYPYHQRIHGFRHAPIPAHATQPLRRRQRAS